MVLAEKNEDVVYEALQAGGSQLVQAGRQIFLRKCFSREVASGVAGQLQLRCHKIGRNLCRYASTAPEKFQAAARIYYSWSSVGAVLQVKL